MLKVGDKIKIISMKDEPHYNGREGTVLRVDRDFDGMWRADGTWGSLALYLSLDSYEIIKEEEKNGK